MGEHFFPINPIYPQSTLVISTSLILNNRLSRSENLVPFKHENLATGNKILWKRSNFSFFPQYFQYISNFRSKITYIFVKCGCSIYFSLILQTCYVEVRVSRSMSEIPLEFEITRVNCIFIKWLSSHWLVYVTGSAWLNLEFDKKK